MRKLKSHRLKSALVFLCLAAVLALCGIVSNKMFYANIGVNDLEDIFGKENISFINGKYYYTGPGVVRIPLEMSFESIASKKYLCRADKETVSNTETLMVTIENNGSSDITNNSNYILMAKSRGHWYVIHTGKLSGETDYWVLEKGGSRTFTLDLTKQGELRDITLEDGKYRFAINVRTLVPDKGEIDNLVKAGFWLSCDFEVK